MSTAALELKQDRRNSMIASIVLHVLLAILFLFIGLKEWDPPIPEEMVEVAMADFGTTVNGMGQVETPNPGEEQSAAAAATEEEETDEVVTDETSDVAVPKEEKKPEKPKDKPAEKPVKPKEPTISKGLEDALNAWGTKGGGSSGEGSSQQPGNAGVPDGVPEGLGTFHGNGWSIALGGRGLVRGPNISEKPEEAGKVVLNIFVDRNGKVTRVTQNLDKSTTTSQVLFNLAKKAALQCTFSSKPDAAAEQKGEMTFIFILE